MTSIIKKLLIAVGITIYLFSVIGCATLSKNPFSRVNEDKFISALSNDTVFAVIPFNSYLLQIEFATEVQNVLLQAGLNVIEPNRGQKTIEERKSAGIEQGGGVADVGASSVKRAEAQALVIEKYITSEDIKADYIVHTMRSDFDGTIKFVRKSDSKVIGVVTVWSHRNGVKSDLMSYLEKLKFIVRVAVDKESK